MANTYTQIHIQTIFAVSHREALIAPAWKDELYKYITGIVQNYDHKLLAINGIADHIHVFFGMRPAQSLSDLMQKIKGDSCSWVNERGFTPKEFRWQEGYGAFSYSKAKVPVVIKYIANQEIHHRKKTFREEYFGLLKAFDIDYDERYIFKMA